MRTIKAAPFARPDPNCFSAGAWQILHGRKLSDGDPIKEWDSSLTLHCVRDVEVDQSMLSRSSGLKPGAYVALIPTWWSDGTGLRGRGDTVFFQVGSDAGAKLIQLALEIPGSEVAHRLQLRTSLVLSTASDLMLSERLAPKREGSVLWEDSISVVLEGEAPRFPISVVDFVENAIGEENACWRFDWTPAEPSLPAMATMRLYVNSRQEHFRAALVNVEPTDVQLAMRSALKHAIAVEMLHLAIQHAGELEIGMPYEVGSAGRVFTDLVSRLLPNLTPISCAELCKTEPGKLSAIVQAKLSLFSSMPVAGGEI